MIQTLSENVIVPIAGLVITYVLCYELISMVTETNNMHDIDTVSYTHLAIDCSINDNVRQLETLQDLKTSLLQQLFI